MLVAFKVFDENTKKEIFFIKIPKRNILRLRGCKNTKLHISPKFLCKQNSQNRELNGENTTATTATTIITASIATAVTQTKATAINSSSTTTSAIEIKSILGVFTFLL